MSETLRKIYKASSDFIGDALLSAEQQVALKTRSLCIPLLADDPWELSNDEDDAINEIVLEDRGLDATPNDGSDEKTKFAQDKQGLNIKNFKETSSMIIAMMIQRMNRSSSQHST